MIIILGSIVNKMGGGDYVYDHLTNKRISTFKANKVFIQAPKIMRKVVVALRVSYLRISGLIGKSNHLRPSTLVDILNTIDLVFHQIVYVQNHST